MGTYDHAIGSTSKLSQSAYGEVVVIKREMVAADIIAGNATLTAAEKITANDIIQAINIPEGFVVLSVGVKVTVAGTAGSTVDIGLAGGTEVVAALDAVTLGETVMEHDATWGSDNTQKLFTAADTLDVQYLADETIGTFVLFLVGYIIA